MGINAAAVTKSDNQGLYTLGGYLLILMAAIAGALALAGLVYFLVIEVGGGQLSHDQIVKWTGLAVFTPIVFGFVVKRNRRYWHAKVFWVVIVSLLILHIGCFLALFRFIPEWRMFWFFVVCTLEIPLVENLATRWMKRLRRTEIRHAHHERSQ